MQNFVKNNEKLNLIKKKLEKPIAFSGNVCYNSMSICVDGPLQLCTNVSKLLYYYRRMSNHDRIGSICKTAAQV